MKVLHFEVSNIEGCPSWLKKLFEFSVNFNIENTRISRGSEYIIVTMKISNEDEEEVIKQNFPFKAKFRKVVRLTMGGTVLVAIMKEENISTEEEKEGEGIKMFREKADFPPLGGFQPAWR